MFRSKNLLILSIIFFVSVLYAGNPVSENFKSEAQFSDLTIELKFDNGELATYCVDSLEEFELLDNLEGVLVCTITHGGTGCSCTGPTCASARACFRTGCMTQIEIDGADSN